MPTPSSAWLSQRSVEVRQRKIEKARLFLFSSSFSLPTPSSLPRDHSGEQEKNLKTQKYLHLFTLTHFLICTLASASLSAPALDHVPQLSSLGSSTPKYLPPHPCHTRLWVPADKTFSMQLLAIAWWNLTLCTLEICLLPSVYVILI